MKMHKQHLILIAVGFILSIAVASYISYEMGKKATVVPLSQVKTLSDTAADNLITSTNSIIQGKITSINGNKATIENNQGKAEVEISDKVTIWKPGSSQPTSNLEDIELNKMAIIQVQPKEGVLKIISINYTPPKKAPKKIN